MGCRVFSLEIIQVLGEEAGKSLEELGYGTIRNRIGDGYRGWPEEAPFDGIVFTAAARHGPPALLGALKPGGRTGIALESGRGAQVLTVVTRRRDGGCEEKRVLPVRFVPLVPGG